jgi:hypothetical protein
MISPGKYAALESLKDELSKETITAEESLRILTSLGDVVLGIMNNLKSTVLGSFKNFKRSEARAYSESHKLSLGQFSSTFIDFGLYKVPTPEGLRVPYIEVSTGLLDIAKVCLIEETLDHSLQYLGLHVRRDVSSYSGLVNETKLAISQISKVSKQDIQTRLRAYFVDAHGDPFVPANRVFIGTSNTLITLNQILSFEEYYHIAANVADKVKQIEDYIDNIIAKINDDKVAPEHEYLENLHKFVYTLAEQIDMFGVVIHEMQRVEHRFIQGLDIILKNAVINKK